ncbi:SPL family radical SAM protein [Peribacillus deserti]|uniref:Radical SAM protein n=1 Tax=Peribacillus deserti TaxID=673318 RepID=A0A2N5M6H1_9BACI|nr:radical SAM protein [Peribacillus deserti]PLT29964.1 radical SAM protein [Peribacillus deserti]
MEIKSISSKKILTEAKGFLDFGYTHSLNPYAGCVFGCSYCYVRELPIQKFREQQWGTWIDAKSNASDIYRKEILNLRKRGKFVRIFMSSSTDPYQPIERKSEITRSLLDAMIDHPPDFLLIQTRSPLITRDIDLLVQLKEKCGLRVSMTVETDREDVRKIFAPHAPSIPLRIKALAEIKKAGIATQAAVSPMLPCTPDFPLIFSGHVDRICIDTLTIGDGAEGRRSKKLGMPQLFEAHGFSKWYDTNLHRKAVKHFLKFYPQDMIFVSQEGFAP